MKVFGGRSLSGFLKYLMKAKISIQSCSAHLFFNLSIIFQMSTLPSLGSFVGFPLPPVEAKLGPLSSDPTVALLTPIRASIVVCLSYCTTAAAQPWEKTSTMEL